MLNGNLNKQKSRLLHYFEKNSKDLFQVVEKREKYFSKIEWPFSH